MTVAPAADADDHFGEGAVGFKWTENDSRDDRWQRTSLGSLFSGTISHADGPTIKGLVIRLGEKGEAAVCYDTDLLRTSAVWTGGFVQFNAARFGLISPPSAAGDVRLSTPALPGWSKDGELRDPRPKPFGPLPRDWAHYRGLSRHGNRVVLEYTLGDVLVRETPWVESHAERTYFTRTLEVAASSRPLTLLASKTSPPHVKGPDGVTVRVEETRYVVDLPAHAEPVRLKLAFDISPGPLPKDAPELLPPEDVSKYLTPAPAVWTEPIVTRGVLSEEAAPYVVDTLTLPFENPYGALMFCSGHDFFSNGDAAVCTVHGDVWRVSGIDERLERLTWRRFATGLFQPLGLKIVADQVYVLGRDQLTRLHDRNGDGEADFYENVNNEGQATANAHEFAACLETDAAGNFYYLRGDTSSQTDHDGCLLQISPDGRRHEVYATGFRNGNGLAIGPDGTITVAPQEGNWTPASAVFHVKRGGFYGAMQSHHLAQPPADYERPLCWIPRLEDNSSGGQAWVTGNEWGPLTGQLLHFSFGTCRMFLVVWKPPAAGAAFGPPPDGEAAGTVAFPLDFASGVMRGRFRSQDGQLYMTGLKGWVSRAVQDGCFQRVRYTGRPVDLPVAVGTYQNGVALTFTRPLERAEAENADNYFVQQWNYRWSADYGSPELKVSQPLQPGRDEVDVPSATLSPDGRTVFLELPELQAVMQLAVAYTLKAADGAPLRQTLNLTVNSVGTAPVPENKLVRLPRPGQLDEETSRSLVSGLVMRFRRKGSWVRGQGSDKEWLDTRRSRMAALHVPEGELATPFWPAGPFEMEAKGYLKASLKGRYRFELSGSGWAELLVNGERVAELTESTPAPAVRRYEAAERPTALHRGFNTVVLRYRAPDRGAASVRAFWASDGFAIEPIPATVLFTDGRDEPLGRGDRWRLGRDLVAEHRCDRCHAAALPVRSPEGPRLDELHRRLNRDWVYAWLLDPRGLRADARMPAMFDARLAGSRQAAADIAAWLTAGALPVAAAAADEPLREKGLVLYETLGCIGCHRITPPSEADELGRLSLALAGQKFRRQSLEAYLAKPHADYSTSRMPDFHLSEEEAKSLAAYVRQATASPLPAAPAGDAARGKLAFTERGCGTCHTPLADAPGSPRRAGSVSDRSTLQERPMTRLDRGCLSETAKTRGQAPDFDLKADQITAIREHLQRKPLSPDVTIAAEESRRDFARLRCGVCHPRDGEPSAFLLALGEDGQLGLSPEQFPNLTWTGERLRSDWMERFIAGKDSTRPRPWLRGRMPSFPADATVLAAGLAHEHGLSSSPEPPARVDRDLAQIGEVLAEKAGGLDCRQCHAIGDRAATGDRATQIALGINFALMGRRLQPEFYHRFVLDPPRYDPGTRMPILIPDGRRTAATEILDGDAQRQLEALWQLILREGGIRGSGFGVRED